MHPIFSSAIIAAPELVLTVGSLFLLLLGTYGGGANPPGNVINARGVTLAAVIILGIAGWAVIDAPAGRFEAFAGLYVADGYSAFLKVLILGAAAASMLLALPWLQAAATLRFEYPVLIALAALGMCLMVSADDMLSLYLGLELQSLAAYVLAAFHRGEGRSAEAGLKYFVLGALASGILLYGITLIYGFTGTTNFGGIALALSDGSKSLGMVFGLVFIVAGLAFKISAVPFHMWTPDVYEGAPTPVAAFFSAAPKAAALGLMVRVLVTAFGPAVFDWQQIVAFLAVASMALGAVAAIAQTSLKRLLAYSSIANIGFALVGLTAATPTGIEALLFYLAVYLAMTLGTFMVVMQLRTPDGRPVEAMADLAGLSRSQPRLALAMAIFMFSLAGIPPLLGFWPKLAVFQAVIDAGLIELAVIGFVLSVVAAYYYLRLVKIMYFEEDKVGLVADGSRANGVMVLGAALFCSPIGMLAMAPIAAATGRATASLFGLG
ncbi:NADH-quinone oxidoreductase subunit N [Polymorphobacter multimanifer]|uniref:NADH-quinone oxidoreductase subunit NuoN n=1 Tax=Polymorphobacter multimanifer TaxID=1070431 RepID=UPI00166C2E12|nr:NADH-quinone oxidoreductase subunit NuoN [Polymorphobacter multimanifer]GGI86620.1 NADH-quinone oxidoreductase subunit N [Polymorphobacter multimanifer]